MTTDTELPVSQWDGISFIKAQHRQGFVLECPISYAIGSGNTSQRLPDHIVHVLCATLVNTALSDLERFKDIHQQKAMLNDLQASSKKWFAENLTFIKGGVSDEGQITLKGKPCTIDLQALRNLHQDDALWIDTGISGLFYRKLVHPDSTINSWSAHGLDTSHACSFKLMKSMNMVIHAQEDFHEITVVITGPPSVELCHYGSKNCVRQVPPEQYARWVTSLQEASDFPQLTNKVAELLQAQGSYDVRDTRELGQGAINVIMLEATSLLQRQGLTCKEMRGFPMVPFHYDDLQTMALTFHLPVDASIWRGLGHLELRPSPTGSLERQNNLLRVARTKLHDAICYVEDNNSGLKEEGALGDIDYNERTRLQTKEVEAVASMIQEPLVCEWNRRARLFEEQHWASIISDAVEEGCREVRKHMRTEGYQKWSSEASVHWVYVPGNQLSSLSNNDLVKGEFDTVDPKKANALLVRVRTIHSAPLSSRSTLPPTLDQSSEPLKRLFVELGEPRLKQQKKAEPASEPQGDTLSCK